MYDLGIMFVAYILLPVSTLINVVLLFPVPQFIKKPIREFFDYYSLRVFVLSLLMFVLYVYNYSITSFDVSEHDTVEIRLEAKSKLWKLERNYHVTLFNAINWAVCTGTENLLKRIDNGKKKEQEKEKKKQ